MTGQASINGVDINTYGASLAKGTYDALNAEAPAKEYISNESRLQHGIRIVAEPENAKLDKREVTIKVLIEGRGAAFHSNVRSFLSAYPPLEPLSIWSIRVVVNPKSKVKQAMVLPWPSIP